MPFIGAETEWEVPYMAGQGLTGRGREGRFARQRARRMSDARRGLLGSGGIVARRGEATMQAIGRWSAQIMWHAAGTERRTAEHRGEELKRTGPSAGREGGECTATGGWDSSPFFWSSRRRRGEDKKGSVDTATGVRGGEGDGMVGETSLGRGAGCWRCDGVLRGATRP